MLGLFLGTLCSIALVATLRRRHHARFCSAYGPAFAYGGWDRYGYEAERPFGHARGSHRHARRGRGRVLFGVFRRLDATPGQEKALLALVERLAQQAGEARKELASVRRELAAALASELLEPAALDAVFTRGNTLFTGMSAELKQALAEAHELLDAEQRKQLAEWLADGSFMPGRHGW